MIISVSLINLLLLELPLVLAEGMEGFPQAGLFQRGEESQDCGVKGASLTSLLAVPGSSFSIPGYLWYL